MIESRAPKSQWLGFSVQLAVALAFADASIVVLALPQIIVRLHTSISDVIWVIMAYNLALILTALLVIRFARQLASTPALIAGLALFGLASVGCGLANSMSVLIPFRALQGIGGGILLCASLPVFVHSAGSEGSPARGWSAAAAIGMAVGPAAGGILTQMFDWRAIFLAQAPVAAITAALVLSAETRLPAHAPNAPQESSPGVEPRSSALNSLTANVSLTLLSAGLISALFLVVLLLINVWRLTPLAAAAIVSVIPLTTVLAERVAGERRSATFGVLGAALVAGGLFGLSFVTHRELVWVLIMLALVGSGLGLSFPGFTTAALRTRGLPGARAAKTVSARDAGIVLGLLILTPVFVHQLQVDPQTAEPEGVNAVLGAPLPISLKQELAPALYADYKSTPSSQLPDFTSIFERVGVHATPRQRVELRALHQRLDSIVETAVTGAFKLPLRYGAVFAAVVVLLAGLRPARKVFGLGHRTGAESL